jgi:hypothetical protein
MGWDFFSQLFRNIQFHPSYAMLKRNLQVHANSNDREVN